MLRLRYKLAGLKKQCGVETKADLVEYLRLVVLNILSGSRRLISALLEHSHWLLRRDLVTRPVIIVELELSLHVWGLRI